MRDGTRSRGFGHREFVPDSIQDAWLYASIFFQSYAFASRPRPGANTGTPIAAGPYCTQNREATPRTIAQAPLAVVQPPLDHDIQIFGHTLAGRMTEVFTIKERIDDRIFGMRVPDILCFLVVGACHSAEDHLATG